jgi:hypothetical protein
LKTLEHLIVIEFLNNLKRFSHKQSAIMTMIDAITTARCGTTNTDSLLQCQGPGDTQRQYDQREHEGFMTPPIKSSVVIPSLTAAMYTLDDTE